MKSSTILGLNLIFLALTDSSLRLHILHTSDVHSHFDMFNWVQQPCNPQEIIPGDKKTKCYGGVVARSGFVNDFRSKHGEENVLLFDSGDQYQGSLWFNVYKGNLSLYFINHMKYDAMVLGNHEFDDGLPGLKPFSTINTPTHFICANLQPDDEEEFILRGVLKPSVTLKRGGRDIGVIGYLTPEVVQLAQTGKITFEDEIECLRRNVQTMNTKQQNIIIALGHSGIETDKKIAKAVPDIDIIVGGHSHTLLQNGLESYPGYTQWGDKVEDKYPLVVDNSGGGKTLIVHPGAYGKYIGVLNVTFDDDGRLTDWSGNTVLIDESTPKDERVSSYLESMRGKVKELYSETIGYATDMFEGSLGICRVEECTIGNLFADAIVEKLSELCGWPNFTSAVVNSGCLRASVNKGAVKLGDLMSVFPFNSLFSMAIVSGEVLFKVFEHSVTAFSFTKRHGKFLQVSGFKVEYDLDKPDGSRVVNVKIKTCYACTEYEDVVGANEYLVAMPQFIIDGGDGYKMLKGSKILPYGLRDLEIIKKYIEKHSPVRPVLQYRIVVKGFPKAFGMAARLSLDVQTLLLRLLLTVAFIYIFLPYLSV